jgi:hypothetical protein
MGDKLFPRVFTPVYVQVRNRIKNFRYLSVLGFFG